MRPAASSSRSSRPMGAMSSRQSRHVLATNFSTATCRRWCATSEGPSSKRMYRKARTSSFLGRRRQSRASSQNVSLLCKEFSASCRLGKKATGPHALSSTDRAKEGSTRPSKLRPATGCSKGSKASGHAMWTSRSSSPLSTNKCAGVCPAKLLMATEPGHAATSALTVSGARATWRGSWPCAWRCRGSALSANSSKTRAVSPRWAAAKRAHPNSTCSEVFSPRSSSSSAAIPAAKCK
mmetsp:Transcript_7800/g.18016  ORF Transcript_7800/g.18016 Transcript_7800/m.18016 type:complete len:237 (+) Transcript_7800:402-1112(+)